MKIASLRSAVALAEVLSRKRATLDVILKTLKEGGSFIEYGLNRFLLRDAEGFIVGWFNLSARNSLALRYAQKLVDTKGVYTWKRA